MEEKITLTNVRPAKGSTHKPKRSGRGISSGDGKTSGRGHRGEGQRSGNKNKKGFEGGQTPAFRRLPKLKGFELINPIKTYAVNVRDLEKLEESEINMDLLKQVGILPNYAESLRILGQGEITKAKKVMAIYFTPSAKEKIEAAGGSTEVV
ncbi:MAG: 50S ribosomal protein L15 [Vampirovibrionia bacterium]